MKRIESRANPWYKTLRQAVRDNAAARAAEGVWLEGMHLCQEYLRRVGQPQWAIFDVARLQGDTAELAALRQALPAECCVALPRELLEGLSPIAGAQGVAFWAPLPRTVLPGAFTTDCVLLDRLQDPGNVGSILRTCAAAGVGQVISLAGGASLWSPKVLRAAQGAHFALELFDRCTPDEVADRLRLPLAATTLDGGRSLYQHDWCGSTAWLFGHEGQGVEPAWLARANHRVFIPQAAGVESLNVAAAAAVCLFEQRRQRLAAPGSRAGT
ncbi:MAG: TrmH family RNA methyltransferase [Pigmentiphaga sp.]